MPNIEVYLKAVKDAEVNKADVQLKDVAKVYCNDPNITAKLKSIKIFTFPPEGEKRAVIGILKLIEDMEKACPNITVNNIGETDILLEWVKVDQYKGPLVVLKVIFVSCVSFFGTGFTIMSFHNDVQINKVFAKVYEMVMGEVSTGYTILEISYSIGLAIGIILFFNHIGGRRITKDPTPIEVAMKKYETDVNTALTETADREGKTIDVS